MTKRIEFVIAVCLFLTLTGTANASILNGGFETGNFSNWQTIGDTSIELAVFHGPMLGFSDALMTTGIDGSGFRPPAVPTKDLEEFLGLGAGALNAVSPKGITIEGSAIKQTFTGNEGDIVSFAFNFLTTEDTQSNNKNDFAFVSLAQKVELLADTSSPLSNSITKLFNLETGFSTYGFALEKSGEYTLGFGVVDVSDNLNPSGLLIDNVQVQNTHAPIPNSLLLFGSGVAGLCVFARRRNKSH